MFKCRLNSFIKPVAILLIVTCFSFASCPKDILAGGVSSSVDTLSPQMWGSPLVSPEIRQQAKLKTVVLNRISQDPAIMDETASAITDLHSNLQDDQLDIFFSDKIAFNIAPGKTRQRSENMFMIPALINNDPYFIFLVQYGDGSTKITLYSPDESAKYLKKMTAAGLIPEKSAEVFSNMLEYDFPGRSSDIQIVDFTDNSIVLVRKFFERIGAKGLSREFEEMLLDKKIYSSEGATFVSEGIVIDENRTSRENALTIIFSLLSLRGVRPFVGSKFEKAFTAYLEEADKFDVDRFDPDIRALLLDPEAGLGDLAGSNEGNIRFGDKAYTSMVDLSGITMDMCEEEIADIEDIFGKIGEASREKYNEGTDPYRQMAESDTPPKKIVIEDFSPGMLPVALSQKDNTIKVNSNFVKFLHKLNKMGLKGMNGKMFDVPRDGENPVPVLGNFYYALIKAVGHHEINGHLKINDWGFAVLHLDEEWAQGERGDDAYPNLVALFYFWFFVVEGGNGLSKVRFDKIFDKYPEILRNLSREQKDKLYLAITTLDLDFLSTRNTDFSRMPRRNTDFSWEKYQEIIRRHRQLNDINSKNTEESKGSVSNEGGLKFYDTAFTSVPDVSYITLNECGETLSRIKEIFSEVIEYEVERYNRKAALRGARKLTKDDVLFNEDKIIVEKLSETIINTMEVSGNGQVKINENFVKVLDAMRRRGADDPDKGRMSFREGAYGYGTTLFDSIIYSMAIHEVRGHFDADENGTFTLNDNEYSAQSERGGSYWYNNIEAMLYFWIYVVNGNDTTTVGYMDVYKFLDENPSVLAWIGDDYRKESIKDLITQNVMNLAERMQSEGIGFSVMDYVSTVPESNNPYAEIAPLDVFRALNASSRSLSLPQIIGRIGPGSSKIALMSVNMLKEIGVIKEALATPAPGSYINRPVYSPVPLAGSQTDMVEEELGRIDSSDSEENIRSVKGAIMAETEKKWARVLLNTLTEEDGILSSRVKGSAQKVVIAIDTDWIQGIQRGYVQKLIKELEKVSGAGNVLIIRGGKRDLASKLESAVSDEGIDLSNVVVMASGETLDNDYLRSIQAKDDNDKDKAFVAEVDASELGEDSYVRVLEMINMAVGMAFGSAMFTDHPNIEVTFKNSRTVVFIPRAEPLDLDALKEIYRNQRRILEAA